eukprot:3795153-Rhodomonas_salina.2
MKRALTIEDNVPRNGRRHVGENRQALRYHGRGRGTPATHGTKVLPVYNSSTWYGNNAYALAVHPVLSWRMMLSGASRSELQPPHTHPVPAPICYALSVGCPVLTCGLLLIFCLCSGCYALAMPCPVLT